jgi:dTDP-L-rhamnose 4-epimerase
MSLPAEATLLVGDVTEEARWGAVLDVTSPDIVVHLAAETATGTSLTQATRHGMVNVVGTTRMLDAMRRSGSIPRHLVVASSRAVYGEGGWLGQDGTAFSAAPRRHEDLAEGRWDPTSPSGAPARPVPSRAASTIPRPSSVYGATKLAQEHLCAAWSAGMGTKLTVLRLQNVYGPGQSLANPYTGVVALFARLALAGQALELYEDGNVVRDFVHVDDVLDAMDAAIAEPPVAQRLLDIGSGTATTISHVASRLADFAGAPAPIVSGRFRDGDVRAASCVIADARAQLAYSPSRSLDDGLRELLAWVEGELGSVVEPR